MIGYREVAGDLLVIANIGKAPASILLINRFAARALAANIKYVSTR